MNHADEKVSESHEQERHASAKTFFDAAIVKMEDLGLWTPASQRTSGPKHPADSIRVRDGKSINSRGKTLKQWVTKLLPTFEELWRNSADPECYNYIPSGMDSLTWWEECETKTLDKLKAEVEQASANTTTKPFIPKETMMTFRYACPDSPYAGLTCVLDGVNNNARLFSSQYRDRRLIIDPKHRKGESNKGATRQQQRANAAAASALGQDPRTPGNVVIARQPLPTPAPNGALTVTEQWIARIGFELELYMVQNLGVDFTNAPFAPSPPKGVHPLPCPQLPLRRLCRRDVVVRGVLEGEVVRPVHGGGVVELVLLHAFERLPLGVNLVLVATTAFVFGRTRVMAFFKNHGALSATSAFSKTDASIMNSRPNLMYVGCRWASSSMVGDGRLARGHFLR